MMSLISILGVCSLVCGPAVAGGGLPVREKNVTLSSLLTPPAEYAAFNHEVRLLSRHACPDFDVEIYEQANGPATTQRVMMAVPRGLKGKAPCVIAPFYFPEAMLGFNPVDGSFDSPYVRKGTNLTYCSCTYMSDLTRRGYITLSADAAHITYRRSGEFDPTTDSGGAWEKFGKAIERDWPTWSGIGKLVFDTRLVVDLAVADPRVDAARIGMVGHSLGGKMAFYAGMTDPRVKAVVASDFGLGWTQSNWHDCWYWGDKHGKLRAAGLSQVDLLSQSGGKPFCLIAGAADDADSGLLMQAARGYEGHPERLLLVRHGTGHRPPPAATETGYRFLDRYLK